MSNLETMVAKLIADTKQFDGALTSSVKVIQRLNKAGEVTGNQLTVLTRRMDDVKKTAEGGAQSLRKFNSTLNSIHSIANHAAGSIKAVFDAASEGAKIQAAETFFQNSGKNIEEYRKAVNGMVSDAELMRKANLADSMGIDEETFKKLARVAEAAALKTGQSFEYMFNSIITGTARGSRLLLDNLGIIVSVKTANERYAESIGKVVEQLTAEEKQLAFVAEVTRQSEGQLIEFAEAGKQAAFDFAQLESALANLGDTIRVTLADAIKGVLPTITSLINDIIDALRSGDWLNAGEYIGLKIAQGIAAGMGEIETYMPHGFIQEKLGFRTSGQVAADQLGVMAEGALARGRESGATLEADTARVGRLLLDKFKDEINRSGGLLDSSDWKKVLQDIVTGNKSQVEKLSSAIIQSGRDFLDANKAAKGIFWQLDKGSVGGDDSKPSVGGRSRGRKKDFDFDFEVGGVETATQTEDFTEALGDALPKVDDLGEVLAAVAAGTEADYRDLFGRAEEGLSDWLAAMKEVAKAEKKRIDELIAAQNAAGAAFTQGLVDGNLFQQIGTAIQPAAAEVLTPALAPVAGPAAPFAAGAIAGLLPVLGKLMDSLDPVVVLLNSLLSGLTALVVQGVGPLLAPLSMLAGPIERLLQAVGLIVDALLATFYPVIEFVIAVFGGLIDVVASVLSALAPFIEMIVLGISALSGLPFLGEVFQGLIWIIDWVVDGFRWMMDGINDAIVRMIRLIPGLGEFGVLSSERALLEEDDEEEATEDNTEAVKANTKAVKDLAREFRNLPSGYKVAQTIQATANPGQSLDDLRRQGRSPIYVGPRTNEGTQGWYSGRPRI